MNNKIMKYNKIKNNITNQKLLLFYLRYILKKKTNILPVLI